jgi:hypothetical protein
MINRKQCACNLINLPSETLCTKLEFVCRVKYAVNLNTMSAVQVRALY